MTFGLQMQYSDCSHFGKIPGASHQSDQLRVREDGHMLEDNRKDRALLPDVDGVLRFPLRFERLDCGCLATRYILTAFEALT